MIRSSFAVFVIRTLALLVCVVGMAGCAGPAAHTTTVEPSGIDLKDEKVIIASVHKNSPAVGVVAEGDEIIEANGDPIASRQDWMDYAAASAKKAEAMDHKIVLMGQDGARKEVTARQLWNPFGNDIYVDFTGEGVIHKSIDPRTHLPISVIHDHGLVIAAWVGAWDTSPQILEADILIVPHKDCNPCSLDGISLYSPQIEHELPLVSSANVSFLVYPPLKAESNPGQYVPVPPPTLAGFNSTTYTNGTIGQTYPGVGGPYSFDATSTTTTTPVYDYTAQNAAVLGNAISNIRNSNASKQAAYRQQFASSHTPRTLTTGKLTPGKTISGILLFQNLGDAEGPFELHIKHNGKPIVLIFGSNSEAATQEEVAK